MPIQIKNLNKQYGNQTVLNQLSLNFPDHTITGIMGMSGAGKTTLLRILLGLEKPDGGQILGLKGQRIATVFQEDRLLEQFDAYCNIELVCKEPIARSIIREEFSKVALNDYEGKMVGQLSGGMKRRIAIVRACIIPSDVIIMDEPLQGLNEELKLEVIEYIKQKCKNKIGIIVSHDESELKQLEAQIITLA